MTSKATKSVADRRLTTWKEIGAFFGRDERTVKRWETARGLPVRRVPGSGRGSVFAYESELAAWLNGEGPEETPGPAPSSADEPVLAPPAPVAFFNEPPKAAAALPNRGHSARAKLWAALAGFLCGGLLSLGTLALVGALPSLPWARGTVPGPVGAPDATAVALYRAGQHAWQTRTPDGLTRAVADFDAAIARAPGYAEAYAGLANCYNLLREYTMMPPEEAYSKARDAAARAVALDPTLSGAHASLAFVEFYWSRDTVGARRDFERAIELEPANALAHHWYATFLMTLGESAASLREIEKAEEHDSESKAILADKGLILFNAGRAEAAIGLLKQLEGEDPTFVSPHRYLADIYDAAGDDENYLRELHATAALLKDESGLSLAEVGWNGLHSGGPEAMRRAMLEREKALFAAGKVSAYALADRFAALGDTDDAVAYLAISLDRREAENIALLVDPHLAKLRQSGRLGSLLMRAGLATSL